MVIYYLKQMVMNNKLTLFALFLLLATVTKAQTTTPTNLPNQNKFTDYVEANIANSTEYSNGIILGFRNVFSFRCSNNFRLGAGIGVVPSEEEFDLPVTLDIRYFFTEKNMAVAPMLNLYTGYSFGSGWINDTYFIAGLNLGVNIALTNHTSLELALGAELYRSGGFIIFERTAYHQNSIVIPLTIGVGF
jgi:hypothetical protein